MSIITLAQAKSHLRVASSSEDTYIQLLLDSVEDWVSEYCGVGLSESTHTERVDGGGTLLRLLHLPVISVTSVTDKDDDTAEDSDDYYASDYAVLREDGDRWNGGRGRWEVVYVGGYGGTGDSSQAVPTGLKLGILGLVARAFNVRSGERFSMAAAGGSMNWGDLLDADMVKILDSFKMGSFV